MKPLSSVYSTPYHDPPNSKRTEMEKFLNLGIDSEHLLLPKASPPKTSEQQMICANSRKKKIVGTLRNLFQFFSMLIEACLTGGLVFYRYLLKLQQADMKAWWPLYLLALLFRLLPALCAMLPQGTLSTPRWEWEKAASLGSRWWGNGVAFINAPHGELS